MAPARRRRPRDRARARPRPPPSRRLRATARQQPAGISLVRAKGVEPEIRLRERPRRLDAVSLLDDRHLAAERISAKLPPCRLFEVRLVKRERFVRVPFVLRQPSK